MFFVQDLCKLNIFMFEGFLQVGGIKTEMLPFELVSEAFLYVNVM